MKTLSKLIYFIFGWKAEGGIPKDITKAIFLIAPHTSNWDFYIGRLYCWINEIPINLLIKEEAFKWPYKKILKKAGGIPVNRSKATSKVVQVANMFKEYDTMFLGITPEGTRKLNNKWKMGFYHIAMGANVPILLSYIDYGKKVAGIGPPFYPTGDIEKDLEEIENFYRGKKAKHPEKFNLNQ
ncbi:MAG: 1-acyl-sn-glycerol-3-phosphate acyltransferase [Bacteroidetes bacterium]|nr:1-acyl-sn-glycerol-3-phosphate acyltransferase [Bacteroidota bacterium]MBL6943880.1 1-acyl-sn-glycerol-3-phosphate acyltransferase [Bacteroidales bacterium]